MIRQRLPDGTYEGQTPCIFLGNVPFDLLMDKRDIWKQFEGFGEIRDIRIRKYCRPLLGHSLIDQGFQPLSNPRTHLKGFATSDTTGLRMLLSSMSA